MRSPDRSLVVDTGLNHAVCLDALQTGLDRIGIDPARCDYFITHLHSDHFGLITRLAIDDTRVYFNRPEAEIIENWQGLKNRLPEPFERAGANAWVEHPYPGAPLRLGPASPCSLPVCRAASPNRIHCRMKQPC